MICPDCDGRVSDTPLTDEVLASVAEAMKDPQCFSFLSPSLTEHAMQLERQNYKLRVVCAAAYQLAGVVGAPVRFLDALGDAVNGEVGRRADIETLLPIFISECDEFVVKPK